MKTIDRKDSRSYQLYCINRRRRALGERLEQDEVAEYRAYRSAEAHYRRRLGK